MTDDPQHDETTLPDDGVEDLAPDDADQDVSGGAAVDYRKLDDSDQG